MATLPGAQALSEWGATLHGFVVGCGEASALVVAHIVNGTPLSAAQLQAALNGAAASGQVLSNGAQTAPQVQFDLSRYGIGSTVRYGSAGLGSLLDSSLAAGKPVVLGVNNGSQLTGEPASLRGHYVTIVGKDSSGYVVADPNTRAAATGGGLVHDTLGQLLGANPFASIIPNSGAGTGVSAASGAGTGTSSGSGGGFDWGSFLQGFSIGVFGVHKGGQPVIDPKQIQNPLDLGSQLAGAIQTDAERVALFILALLVIVFGGLLLFWPQAVAAGKQSAQAAGTAAKAAAVAA